MKKFIALAIALVSFSAVADHHGRHMITLGGWENDRDAEMARSLDLYRQHGEGDGTSKTSYAINYAYAVTSAIQVGALYKSWEEEDNANNSVESTVWGAFVIYNFAGRLTDTNYLGLKYTLGEREDKAAGVTTNDVDTTTWALEFGRRVSLGSVWNMNFNWSPSIELALENSEPKGASEYSTTEWRLNVLKVDVIF